MNRYQVNCLRLLIFTLVELMCFAGGMKFILLHMSVTLAHDAEYQIGDSVPCFVGAFQERTTDVSLTSSTVKFSGLPGSAVKKT